MTVKDLYSAMSGIEDRYLAMADAPNKEDISMKKHSWSRPSPRASKSSATAPTS